MKVKTIICPECNAEQAIIRDSENKMKCAFCGTVIDNLPEYDESENLDIASQVEEPLKIEPQGEPIKASFVLNEQEVYNALTTAGKLKKRKAIPIIEAVVFGLLGLSSLTVNIMGIFGTLGFSKGGFSEWLFMIFMFAMIPIVFLLPEKAKKTIVKNATTGNKLCVTVYENVANIEVEGSKDEGWQLLLNGEYTIKYENDLSVLNLPTGQILVIPDRAVNEQELYEFHSRITPKTEEKK